VTQYEDDEPVGAFPLESDEDDQDDPPSLGPGEERRKDWFVYAGSDRDEPIGVVHVRIGRPTKQLHGKDRVQVGAVFELEEGNELVAEGMLPARPDRHFFGEGGISILGGTGPYAELGGRVLKVQVKNPKRWSIGGP
jgi:hypothetical protein